MWEGKCDNDADAVEEIYTVIKTESSPGSIVGLLPRDFHEKWVVLGRSGDFFEAFLVATQAGVDKPPRRSKYAEDPENTVANPQRLCLKSLYRTRKQRGATTTTRSTTMRELLNNSHHDGPGECHD